MVVVGVAGWMIRENVDESVLLVWWPTPWFPAFAGMTRRGPVLRWGGSAPEDAEGVSMVGLAFVAE